MQEGDVAYDVARDTRRVPGSGLHDNTGKEAGCGGGPMPGQGVGGTTGMAAAQRRFVEDTDRAFKSGYECGRIDSQDPVHFLFQYHKGGPEQLPKFDAINIACENLFRVIQSQCPPGEDKYSALKQIQICRMLANMSVALNGKGVQYLPGVMG